MTDYSKMTQEDFDRILITLIDRSSAGNLLHIPGVYELVAESYNNDVLDYWEHLNLFKE